jgi:cytochrome P450
MPFAAGLRDCVGKNLSYSEMCLVVARLLWNFDVEKVEGQEHWISNQRTFTVYHKSPLMIKLKPLVDTSVLEST